MVIGPPFRACSRSVVDAAGRPVFHAFGPCVSFVVHRYANVCTLFSVLRPSQAPGADRAHSRGRSNRLLCGGVLPRVQRTGTIMKLESVDRAVAVQSSNIDLGDALRQHAEEAILRVASKYFGRLNVGSAHFNKEGINYRCTV